MQLRYLIAAALSITDREMEVPWSPGKYPFRIDNGTYKQMTECVSIIYLIPSLSLNNDPFRHCTLPHSGLMASPAATRWSC